MDKHLEIFCKQNPTFECECRGCKTKNKIPMKDFLKKKYEYVMTCKKCGATTNVDTHDFHKKLDFLKQFSS